MVGEINQARALYCIAFSPDGRLVLIGRAYNAQLYETATAKPVGSPLKHKHRVVRAAFSPDSRLVLTASWDNTARLWDTANGKPTGPPLQHRGILSNAAFSPDGRLVLTGSIDKTARLWQVDTGKPLGPPLQHEYPVEMVAFRPDGHVVATASGNAARLWPVPAPLDLPPGELVAWASALTGLELDEFGAVAVSGGTWQQLHDREYP